MAHESLGHETALLLESAQLGVARRPVEIAAVSEVRDGGRFLRPS